MGLWSDPKSEFCGTESPYPDPRESQICLLGMLFGYRHHADGKCPISLNIQGVGGQRLFTGKMQLKVECVDVKITQNDL